MKKIGRALLVPLSLFAAIGIFAITACPSSGDEKDAPTIVSTAPIDGATGVARNATINATFSEEMEGASISGNFALSAANVAVAGIVSYDDSISTAYFTPDAPLESNTAYTATVGTGARDLAGNGLEADAVWTFTTGALLDETAPIIVSTSPINDASGIGTDTTITARFDEGMDTATLIPANFTLTAGAAQIAGSVVYDLPNESAIFAPAEVLANGTLYTATVSTGAKDLAGNALAADKVWTFTTGSAGMGPAPVLLGTAGNFAVLAKSAISTVPDSVITGDVGVSPAARSFLTGFSDTLVGTYSTSPQVTGFMYAANMAPPTPANMTTAISNMEAAYTDAAGRPTPDFTNLHSGAIGGQVLVPGLYKWTSTVTIPTDLTIQGGGGNSDVWIFQITGNLTQSDATEIFLTGGAQAKNIFWQVSGQTAVGTDAILQGTVLCKTSITLGTHSTLNGRALSQTNVALSQATVTKPTQ